MSFAGKVVLVTGAGSGIGAATAVLFAREGAHVALVDRNETGLNNVAQWCSQYGPQHLIIKADVTKAEAATIVQKTIDKFGRLDVLINNAGVISNSGSLLEGSILDAYDAIMQTNLRAVIQLTMLAVPTLIKTKGNIINISSAGSLCVTKETRHATYCISKAALDHFTRCAALELAPSGIRVNSVNPGPVKTELLKNAGLANPDALWAEFFKKTTALNRVAEPEEIADLVLFLASDKARSITGSSFVSDNGYLLKN